MKSGKRRMGGRAAFEAAVLWGLALSLCAGGAAEAAEKELYGRYADGEGLHRILIMDSDWRTALRFRCRGGELDRWSVTGEGRRWAAGTLRETGLPALMGSPLSLSLLSGRGIEASGLAADIAAKPARRNGAALLLPELGGVYILRGRESTRTGCWLQFPAGEGQKGTASAIWEVPEEKSEAHLHGASALLSGGLRPLRFALRVCGGSEGGMEVQMNGFLTLSSVLPPGWAGSVHGTIERGGLEVLAGAGIVAGAYPDRRGRLLQRRFRGGLRAEWVLAEWCTAGVQARLRLRLPGDVIPETVSCREEGEGSVMIGPAECRLEVTAEGSAASEDGELPELRRDVKAGLGGQCELFEWELCWHRRDTRGQRETTAGVHLEMRQQQWRLRLEGEALCRNGSVAESRGGGTFEYEDPRQGCRLWAELGYDGLFDGFFEPGMLGGGGERGAVHVEIGYEITTPAR